METNYSDFIFVHVFNKSIANFRIFQHSQSCWRFIQALDYYNKSTLNNINLSVFLRKKPFYYPDLLIPKNDVKVKFLTYSIMPDHYHLLLKIKNKIGLSKYINDVENSYTRYFNINFNRKGPLWQRSYKYIVVKTDEQLIHVSRYINLNATTNNLVDKPEDWEFSSYKKMIGDEKYLKEYLKEISINYPKKYQQFVENNIDYQRKLKEIKRLVLEKQ